MSTKLFSELGLSEEILKAVQRLGFEQASPIQAEAIPVLMTGKDIVGQSQTGSGKTAAFAIPAIERMDPKAAGPQVLILCPALVISLIDIYRYIVSQVLSSAISLGPIPVLGLQRISSLQEVGNSQYESSNAHQAVPGSSCLA